ncbi:hypothetical protein PR001_g2739 [Phytophthora rubi]|uniref:HAT C-terminal dimerisation domain-containing protein n=2 Tax=Phytophthora rubi TaxID=129364 RepID=A0A6A3PBJ3_9STRA|nr:hypothetical protein PR001_g2739 [Phytophthora rubi]
MRKLKTVKRIAKLKQHGCTYKPVLLLRWSGCYRMPQRFEDFRPDLRHFQDDSEVDRDLPADAEADDIRRVPFVDRIPSMSEQRKISELLDDMNAFDVVTGNLQCHDMTVATVRDIFDIVLDDYDNMEKYLAPDADIVECPDFKRGLAKIQGGEFTLLRNERKARHRLLAEPQDQPRTVATSSTPNKSKRKRAAEALDENISKKARKMSTRQSKYSDASWIPATSIVVERFFSTVKSTIGYLRKSMSSETLEVIMFLKLNWDLVTLADVSSAIVQSKTTMSRKYRSKSRKNARLQ